MSREQLPEHAGEEGFVVEVFEDGQWWAEEWHRDHTAALLGMRQYIQDMYGLPVIGTDIRVHWAGNCAVCEAAIPAEVAL